MFSFYTFWYFPDYIQLMCDKTQTSKTAVLPTIKRKISIVTEKWQRLSRSNSLVNDNNINDSK